MRGKLITIIGLCCIASGCASVRQGIGQGLQNAAAIYAAQAVPDPPKLMLFGGEGHDVYLGCLNCPNTATDSIFNRFATQGSPFAAESIWNRLGVYASRFSQQGTCNSFAADPPVIVDQYGTFYGRLTVNTNHRQLGIGAQYVGWLKENIC